MARTGQRSVYRTTCFVLAGGMGKRLRPLTLEVPKPLLPFGAVHCLLDFTLSNIANSGLSGAYVLSQYRQDAVAQHLREHWVPTGDHGALFLNRPPANGKRYRGTADAVAQNLGCVSSDSDLVLVLSADHVYKMDYGKLLDHHFSCGRGVTVAVTSVPLDDARKFGVMSVNDRGDVIGFEEKPDSPRPMPGRSSHALANMGIYVFDPSTLREVLVSLGRTSTALDFGRDVLPYLARRGLAARYPVEGDHGSPYWRDVGTLAAYHESHMDLLEGRLSFDPLDPHWPVRSAEEPSVREHSIVGGSVHLGDCVVERSVIASGAVIEDGAYVSRSIVLPGAHVGRRARVRNAIVEAGARIRSGDRIGFDRTADSERFDMTGTGVTIFPFRHAGASTLQARRARAIAR